MLGLHPTGDTSKVLYPACIAKDKHLKAGGTNPTGQVRNWKEFLNVPLLTYGDRLYPTN
ncbi:MAG: hypothetical protein NVV57_10380 [Demequina sp.]|jgi:hypothetical protein|nr:hypothetical protein [Demequina sp.]